MEAILFIGFAMVLGGLLYLGSELGKARTSLSFLETEVSEIEQRLTSLSDMVKSVQDALE
jgi:Tfp pilus assembly protein PilN